MRNALCIIPARGGSKRIPRKNLLPLAGKPLLAYTIEAALKSGVFLDVVVSSDDQEILGLAGSLGAVADIRPEELSGDTIRFVQVVEEYLLRPGMRQKYETIAGMLPTCPFRTAEDVRRAFDLFSQQAGNGYLLSVTEYDFPPQLALDFAEDGVTLTMRDPVMYGKTTRSQSIGKSYHPNGAIYLASVDGFLREKTFFANPMFGYLMPAERSFDIDYPYQFAIAEAMMQEQIKGGLHGI
jgi:CMP-N-acetylneuraminic acid synthetase